MPSAWERPTGCLLSSNEKNFILKAVEKEDRVDGRKPYDYRKLQIQIALDGRSVTILLGQTLVEATLSASIEQPAPERPNEGTLVIRVDCSPMAAPGLDASKFSSDSAIELQRMLEKSIRDIRAVDQEALCIASGQKVWKVSVDLKILDAAGNAVDAVFLATLAALMAFKRPEVTVGRSEDGHRSSLTVHSMDEREALPLSLHQAPLAISFALFKEGEAVLVDPQLKEEAAAEGTVTIVLNAHDEVCLLHKAGGLGLELPQIMRLIKIAAVKRGELGAMLKAALEAHETARVAARVRRKEEVKAVAPLPSRGVSVLLSADIAELEAQLGVSLKALEEAAAAGSSSEEESEGQDMSGTEGGLEQKPLPAQMDVDMDSDPNASAGQKRTFQSQDVRRKAKRST